MKTPQSHQPATLNLSPCTHARLRTFALFPQLRSIALLLLSASLPLPLHRLVTLAHPPLIALALHHLPAHLSVLARPQAQVFASLVVWNSLSFRRQIVTRKRCNSLQRDWWSWKEGIRNWKGLMRSSRRRGISIENWRILRGITRYAWNLS